jgi:hydroxymethylpyrimidine/phosphomethylpyrimidine kinase
MSAVLSIGTTHPWNIAGVGLDLRVGAEAGARVLTVVTAVSAQDARGIHSLHGVPAADVRAQFDALPLDEIHAIRVGALTSPETAAAVGDLLRRLYDVPAVVDPVIAATRGGTFADDATLRVLRAEIATLPSVVLTPNVEEASALLRGRTIDRDNLADAARDLQRLGSRAVLLKGGHLDGNPVDALATADAIELFTAPRLPGDLRGTGCLLAMALAIELADGHDLRSAVQHARVFLRKKIAAAREFGGLQVPY